MRGRVSSVMMSHLVLSRVPRTSTSKHLQTQITCWLTSSWVMSVGKPDMYRFLLGLASLYFFDGPGMVGGVRSQRPPPLSPRSARWAEQPSNCRSLLPLTDGHLPGTHGAPRAETSLALHVKDEITEKGRSCTGSFAVHGSRVATRHTRPRRRLAADLLSLGCPCRL